MALNMYSLGMRPFGLVKATVRLKASNKLPLIHPFINLRTLGNISSSNFGIHSLKDDDDDKPQLNLRSQRQSLSTYVRDDTGRRNMVEADLGRFLTRTYAATGAGVVGYFAAAQLAAMTGVAFYSPYMLLGAGFVGSIGSSMMIAKNQPQYVSDPKTNELMAINSPGRQLAFATLCGSFGLMSSPLLAYISYTNPTIIGAALVCSTGTMAGASAYALTTKKDVTVYGSALSGGLFGIIGVSLGGLAAGYMGYPNLAHSLHSFVSYGSVVIFTGLTAYDTQMALQMHRMRQPDHLAVAAQFFMNFANLFQSFLHIFHNNE
mmetsp:Transcript_15290/g.18920  ORF Transcript_15290/g.18920 Transcript_15290/m.18920 type:complete len:319 (-) Transcript_15290:386-1342(-)